MRQSIGMKLLMSRESSFGVVGFKSENESDRGSPKQAPIVRQSSTQLHLSKRPTAVQQSYAFAPNVHTNLKQSSQGSTNFYAKSSKSYDNNGYKTATGGGGKEVYSPNNNVYPTAETSHSYYLKQQQQTSSNQLKFQKHFKDSTSHGSQNMFKFRKEDGTTFDDMEEEQEVRFQEDYNKLDFNIKPYQDQEHASVPKLEFGEFNHQRQ